MTPIVFKGFKGETPRVEPHLLGLNNAQYAKDCEFDSGALTPIADDYLLATVLSNPARSFYTEDGTTFFSWPQETLVFNNPLNVDTFNRIYYMVLSEGILRVANRTEMAPNGPTPNGVRAGLPNPTVKPVLSLRNRTTLPDYPVVTITAESWWADTASGTVVNKGAAAVTPLTALRVYQIAKPPSSGKPASARMYAKLIFTDSNTGKEIFSLQTYTNGVAVSQGVPGTVEGRLEEDATRGVMYLTWGVAETRAYTYVYRNTWNEDSAAAPPEVISPTYVQDVQIDVTPGDFTGYRPFLEYRIFRTYGTTATYLRTLVVQDGGVPTRFYDTTTQAANIDYALDSESYSPLGTGMQGMEVAPNGWAAAFKDKTLYLSEPYKLHAWPYSTTFAHPIRGVIAGQSSLVVTTTGGVYALTGTAPDVVSQMKIALPQAGIAQRSMVNMDGAVVFASNDGLAMVAGSQGSMDLSQKLFNRKKWREMYGDILLDASMTLGYHDGMVVAQSHTTAKGFVVRLDDDAGAFTRNANRYDGMKRLPVADALYYSIANQIFQFRGGPNKREFVWQSKDFILPRHGTIACGYIRCDGPIVLELFADGVLVDTRTVTNGHFRVKDLNLALRWSVRLTGSSIVRELALARSMKDLQNVA